MDFGYLFETLASATWQRLADAERLRVSQGETALTDHLLLEMARFDHPHLRVVKTSISEEDKQGTDWEWWIGTPAAGWLRYAAQAKRVTVSSSRYDQLGHMVGSRRRLEILRTFASANDAIPIYCLYNNVTGIAPTHWHCERRFEPAQLGCSIAPIDIIDAALSLRGCRTFDYIHRNETVVP